MIKNIDDILQLPFFEYPTKRIIPDQPCVYFIFSDMKLLYIGSTCSLKNRISRHHVLKYGSFGNIRIHYTGESYPSVARLLEVERKLIKELAPRLNKQKFRTIGTCEEIS